MSVQFGRCNFDGKAVNPQDLDDARPVLAPYGPDGEGYICKDNFGILYRAFHTTKESRRESQPHVSRSSTIITWDGRLDNREDLIERLAGELSPDSTDLEIAAAAHERWGTEAFRELIGDWALSVWDPKDRALILAKDFIGTRHLYYKVEKDQVTWCTILDPLVLLAGCPFMLEEEYIAGWLSYFPATHLTPYAGIQAVPASSFVRIAKGNRTIDKYWDFDPAKRIRYRDSTEYEEHFRAAFSESVRRRLRSDSPVLAELSGGVDSSSIVCVADSLLRQGKAVAPRVDTVSHYDDSEPNWNERPYFTKIEEKRGRKGCHIDVSPTSPKGAAQSAYFAVTPGAGGRSDTATIQFIACLTSQKNRVVLSGTGGDEFTGGVPTPAPELADLLTRLQFRCLAHQLKLWALNKRKPWFQLLWEAVRGFLPSALLSLPPSRLPPWLYPSFVRNHRNALNGYQSRLRLFGGLPSFQRSLFTLDLLRRQLACSPNVREPLHERRYPYLDRDLVEFLCAIPCEQLVRPNQRRSLMRRALVGLVPDEILSRRRKAFLVRSPTRTIAVEWQDIADMG